jgi:hypothetical protein
MSRIAFVVVAVAVIHSLGAPEVQAQPVAKITIQFHTVDDDKDHDTKVWTYIKSGDTVLASKEKYADSTRFKIWGTRRSSRWISTGRPG